MVVVVAQHPTGMVTMHAALNRLHKRNTCKRSRQQAFHFSLKYREGRLSSASMSGWLGPLFLLSCAWAAVAPHKLILQIRLSAAGLPAPLAPSCGPEAIKVPVLHVRRPFAKALCPRCRSGSRSVLETCCRPHSPSFFGVSQVESCTKRTGS